MAGFRARSLRSLLPARDQYAPATRPRRQDVAGGRRTVKLTPGIAAPPPEPPSTPWWHGSTTGTLEYPLCRGWDVATSWPPPPLAFRGLRRVKRAGSRTCCSCWPTSGDRARSGSAPTPLSRTPHFDRLASEGANWRRAYAANPVCTPNRGLHPDRPLFPPDRHDQERPAAAADRNLLATGLP